MTKHWYIPTPETDAREGGAWWRTACLAAASDISKTETPKKVTCKQCRELYLFPPTPQIMAAKLWSIITRIQEDNDYIVEVKCNACVSDIDVSEMLYGDVQDNLNRIMHLLEHCAFEHMGGAEVMLSRTEAIVSAYELNYAERKDAMTAREEAWREGLDLVVRR